MELVTFGRRSAAALLGLFALGPGAGGQEPISASNPRWAPDGSQIVFYAEVGGQTDLFLRSRAGENRKLTSGVPSDYGPDFSPNGDLIAFYSGSDGRFGIELIGTDGSPRASVKCGGEYEGNPHFSPDGLSLTFSSNRDGNHEIYIATLAESACRRLTQHPGNDWTPRFSPDGSQIVFASDRRGQFDIYTMAVDGTDVRLVADANEHDYYPDWSPDGSRIAFFSGPDYDAFQVHVVDLVSGKLTQVTRPPMTATNPAWSPDGEWLLVGATRQDRDELLLVRPDGSGSEPLVIGRTGPIR